MTEVWVAAVVTVGGAVVSGMGQEKKDKKDKAFQAAMTQEESKLAAQRTGYESALEEFHTQKERKRKQRGLDQFRQFSTMGEFTPGYDINSEARVEPGNAPNYNEFDPEYNPNPAVQQGVQKKIVDPLGLF